MRHRAISVFVQDRALQVEMLLNPKGGWDHKAKTPDTRRRMWFTPTKSPSQLCPACVLCSPLQGYREVGQQKQILHSTLMKASDNWNLSLVFDTCPRENLLCVNTDRTQQPMFKHCISSSCLTRMHPIHLLWGKRGSRISEWWNPSEESGRHMRDIGILLILCSWKHRTGYQWLIHHVISETWNVPDCCITVHIRMTKI